MRGIAGRRRSAGADPAAQPNFLPCASRLAHPRNLPAFHTPAPKSDEARSQNRGRTCPRGSSPSDATASTRAPCPGIKSSTPGHVIGSKRRRNGPLPSRENAFAPIPSGIARRVGIDERHAPWPDAGFPPGGSAFHLRSMLMLRSIPGAGTAALDSRRRYTTSVHADGSMPLHGTSYPGGRDEPPEATADF